MNHASCDASSGYQPQIDGLRAVAMFGVLASHFGLPLPHAWAYGPLSVRFFFLLSGYLITRSLLKARDRDPGSHWKKIPAFYLQRALRILPLHLFLALCLLAGFIGAGEAYLWHATFLSNFFAAQQGWWPLHVPHLWSISVQEQFYLLWPFLIFFCPRRHLVPAMLALAAAAWAYRAWCFSTGVNEITRWVMLPGCFDAFAAGGLLAVWRLRPSPAATTRFFVLTAPVAVTALVVGRQLRGWVDGGPLLASVECLEAVFLFWLTAFTLQGLPGPAGRLLCWKPLVFLGTISYGIYLYHMLMPGFWEKWHPAWQAETHWYEALPRFILLTAATVLLSWLSWNWLEKPFLSLKGQLKKAPAPALGTKAPAVTGA